MGYIDKNLLSWEDIIYEWSIHMFYKFLMCIGICFWILMLISLIQAWGTMWLIGIAIICPFAYKLLYFITTDIAVTNKRVIYKTGIIARNVFELQIEKVESARLDQSIFQRIIRAGTLIVSWTWGHSKPIEYLWSPVEMRSAVYTQIQD